MKKLVIYHIIPLIIAFGIAFLLFFFINQKSKKHSTPKIYKPIKSSGIYANYDNGISSELDLIYALQNNSLIIWGSSELTGVDSLGYQPYDFFPNNFNIPSLAIGHAGNQSFSIFCQIAAMSQYVIKSKMVIIVSPGWFTGGYAKGTSTTSFLEFNNERFLKNTYNSNIAKKYKNYISEYLYKNRYDINAPTFFMESMMYYKRLNKINLKFPYVWLTQSITKTLYPNYNKKSYSEYFVEPINEITIKHKIIKWDSLKAKAVNDFEKISNNNNVGVNSKYFTLHVEGRKFKQIIGNIENNCELKDFEMLVSLINHLKIEPVFIIQNLNPLVYSNLQEMKPIIDTIISITNKFNYPTLNMFTPTVNNYQQGELTDVMHMGDLGWIKVNQFIYNNLYKNETTIQPKKVFN